MRCVEADEVGRFSKRIVVQVLLEIRVNAYTRGLLVPFSQWKALVMRPMKNCDPMKINKLCTCMTHVFGLKMQKSVNIQWLFGNMW